jgi:hypothetical protein
MSRNPLESLMAQAFENADLRDQFFGELLAADLFVLVESNNPKSVVHHKLDDGTVFAPVFTSQEELENTIEEGGAFATMEGHTLLEMLQDSIIIVNPASDMALQLDHDAITDLLTNFSAFEIANDERSGNYMAGLPDVDPVQLKSKISGFLKKDSRVLDAYLCELFDEETEERAFVVGVSFKDGEEYPQIFDVIDTAVAPVVPEGYVLDFTLLTKQPDQIGQYLIEEGDHFYQAN